MTNSPRKTFKHGAVCPARGKVTLARTRGAPPAGLVLEIDVRQGWLHVLLLRLADQRYATSHKKNNTEDPNNRAADKHKLAQRRAARQFGCL